MNRLKKNTNSNSSKTNQESVKFEETNEGRILLNSINPAFQKIRKENEYRGELRIMQNLTKKSERFIRNNTPLS